MEGPISPATYELVARTVMALVIFIWLDWPVREIGGWKFALVCLGWALLAYVSIPALVVCALGIHLFAWYFYTRSDFKKLVSAFWTFFIGGMFGLLFRWLSAGIMSLVNLMW